MENRKSLNYDELNYECRDAVELYEMNGRWYDDIRETILAMKNPKEIVLSCLIDSLAEYYHAMEKAKETLVNYGFTNQDINYLTLQYVEKCND